MEKKNDDFFRPVLPIFFVVLIDMIGFGIVIPLLAPLLLNAGPGLLPVSSSFQDRVLMLGLLISTFPIMQFFSSPLLGALSDKHGRKKVLMYSLLGAFAGYIIFAVGIMLNNLALLFIGRAIDGFMGGNITVAYSVLADISDEKSKARNFGFIGMAFGFGFIIGPFIGGKLADPSLVGWFNFSTPFLFAALLALLNTILVKWKFRETLATKIESKIDLFTGVRNIKKAFAMPNLRLIFIVIFLLTFGFSFFTQFSQVFMVERFSFNQSQIGDIFAYIGIWIALTQGLIMRPVSKHLKPEQVLKFSTLGLAVTILWLIFIHSPDMLLLNFPLIAIFQGLTYPNYTAIVSNLAGRESQGEILGINSSIQALGFAIPPIISGVIVSLGLVVPLIASALLVFLGWLGFVLFFRPMRKEVFHEV